MSRFSGFPLPGATNRGPAGTTPAGIPGLFVTPGGGLVDRLGMPQVVPSDDASRRQAGLPPIPQDRLPLRPAGAPPVPEPPQVMADPDLQRRHDQARGIPPAFPQQNVRSVPGAGVDGATLPPFFFQQGPPAPPPAPLSNRDFLASDPGRTIPAGSLSGLSGLLPFLSGGGGGGLDLNAFNASLAARGASEEADLRAEADAQGLALRQSLARRGILSSGLAAGAEADISGSLLRGLGVSRANILGATAQAGLASQQIGANAELERRRMIFSMLQSIPGLSQVLGGLGA